MMRNPKENADWIREEIQDFTQQSPYTMAKNSMKDFALTLRVG